MDELVVTAKRNDAQGSSDTGSFGRTWSTSDGQISGYAYDTTLAGGGGDPRSSAVQTVKEHVAANNAFSSADLALMRQYNIDIGEVLRPGLHQQAFEVQFQLPGSRIMSNMWHYQWVNVLPGGQSQVLTGRPVFSGGLLLDTSVENWNASEHGRAHTSGPIQTLPVGSTIGDAAETNARWTQMVAEATQHDMNRGYSPWLNSNSIFYTAARAGGITPYVDHYAPGMGNDLDQAPPLWVKSVQEYEAVIDGGAGADALLTDPALATALYGYGGDDNLTGRSMIDHLDGGEGQDTITLAGGIAIGGAGADTITASTGGIGIQAYGDAGADTIYGGSSGDALHGGDDADFLHGRVGNDFVDGGGGADIIYGGQGADTLKGGDGADSIRGDLHNDSLMGEAGADLLEGYDGDDALSGGGGDDTLVGGAGDDFFRGGVGADALWGGAGADVFSVGPSVNHSWFAWMPESGGGETPGGGWYARSVDTIHDFEDGIDKIDLSEWGLTFDQLVFAPLYDGTGMSVQWTNPNMPQGAALFIAVSNMWAFDSSDFIFA